MEKSDMKKVEGRYANYFEVGFNAYEFLIDFCQYFPSNGCCPENEGAELCQRFITSPTYAKTLLKVLQKSVEDYEEAFGLIEESENGSESAKQENLDGSSVF
jgi:hypothetical protein